MVIALLSMLIPAASSQDGGYHVPFAHKSLAAGLELGGYASTMHERVSIQRVAPAADGGARLSGARFAPGLPLCMAKLPCQLQHAWLAVDRFEVGSGPVISTHSSGLPTVTRCDLTAQHTCW